MVNNANDRVQIWHLCNFLNSIRVMFSFTLNSKFLPRPSKKIEWGTNSIWADELEWRSYRKEIKKDVLSHFSRFRLFVTPGTTACQVPLSMGLSGQFNSQVLGLCNYVVCDCDWADWGRNDTLKERNNQELVTFCTEWVWGTQEISSQKSDIWD